VLNSTEQLRFFSIEFIFRQGAGIAQLRQLAEQIQGLIYIVVGIARI
jgi:hypothetical protein